MIYSTLDVNYRVDSSWNVMAHGDAREGKWRGKWGKECVASTLHTTSEHGLSSITTADAHTSTASSRLNWRPPADLNGLVLFAERGNLVPARVPSRFKRSLPQSAVTATSMQYGELETELNFEKCWVKLSVNISKFDLYWTVFIWYPRYTPECFVLWR